MAKIICGECKRVIRETLWEHIKQQHTELYVALTSAESKRNEEKKAYQTSR